MRGTFLLRTSYIIFVLFISHYITSPVIADETYFIDEFNENRTINTVDNNKWNSYYSPPGPTFSEDSGFLTLSSTNSKRFPYVITKTNPIPTTGDFTVDLGFQYNSIEVSGTGLVLSINAPSYGTSEVNKNKPDVYFFGIWQDKNEGFNVTYNGYCTAGISCTDPGTNIYKKLAQDLSFHKVKIVYSNSKYHLFLDDNKIFTSPDTNVRPKSIWFGNPVLIGVNATWTSFKVDYVRVTALPTQFLDLPWDYESKGLTFSDAALSINSYFDHDYPLLSAGLSLSEPLVSQGTLRNYLGKQSSILAYSKHDGYDYGRSAKANLGDPVLAAASGMATYINSCNSCGNMIVIDHGNGYQTRYMHLLKDGLLTSTPNTPVPVSDRQPIGKLGFSGNVWPQGEGGAHIHFGVYQDKDGDGYFEDNVPDGVTDPYGWQSSVPDPWESFTFFYLGKSRNGNKSNYLWKKPLAGEGGSLTSAPKNLSVGGYNVNFPANTTTPNLNLDIHSTPNVQLSSNQVSIKPPIEINTTTVQGGNPVTQLEKPYTISTDLAQADLSRVKPETLSFYSTTDQENWIKETTTFPSPATASATINHTGEFALIAERKDTTAPITSSDLQGNQGQPSIFRSDVTLTLTSLDNEGGLGVELTSYRINEGKWEQYLEPLTFSDEGHFKVEYYSIDKDDNTEEVKSVEFDLDKTAPTITGSFSPSPNQDGWNNSDVTVHFECADSFSGVANCTPDTLLSSEGDEQSVIGTAVDNAGNTTNFTVSPINIDKTIPNISFNLTPSILWPITGKMTDISLVGKIVDEYFSKGVVNIEDEYNLIEPSIEDINDLNFSTTFQLLSSRNGEDLDGRTYTLRLTAFDLAGNIATQTAQIIVPHDKRR